MLLKKKAFSVFLAISLILPSFGSFSYAFENDNINEVKEQVEIQNVKKKKVSKQLEAEFDLDEVSAKRAAEQVGKYKLDENFEYAVKEVLNHYYENGQENKIEQFKDEVDSRANQILADYEEAEAEKNTAADELGYEAGKILVEFADDVNQNLQEQIVESLDGKVVNSDKESIGVVEISNFDTVEKALESYEDNKCIKSAQPNYVYKLQASTSSAQSTNDTYLGRQYYLGKLKIDDAWDYISESNLSTKKVKVAVIDTGIDTTHPDLKGNLLMAKNGVDGFTDSKNDIWFHGTHVSGIIGATANNSMGIAGVANNNVELISINVFRKTTNSDGGVSYLTYTDDMIDAYKYAVKQGVSVINMSLGRLVDLNSYNSYDKELDTLLKKEIDSATAKGIVTVCAAGNDGSSLTFYPADYDSCISVINIDTDNEKAWDSNYGTKKDISAYGVGIYSTVPLSRDDSRYSYESGTSMAAPIVTGVVALMKSINPSLSVDTIKNMIYNSADDIGKEGKDSYTGYGRINALEAVKAAHTGVIPKSKLTMPTGVTINTIDSGDTTVKGTAYKYSTIKVYNENGTLVGTSKATSTGSYSVRIPKQKGGSTIKVVASKTGYYSKSATKKVLKRFSVSLTASTIYSTTRKVTGKGSKNATITAYVNGKKIGSTTVRSTGSYTLTIPRQKKGKVVTIKMTKSGYVAKSIKRTVK